MKQPTKIETGKLVAILKMLTAKLGKPENLKKVAKIFALIFIAVFGLCFSASLISTGLVLIKESGVPDYIIKGAAGVTALIVGYAVLGVSVGRPARTLYKMVMEELQKPINI